jgi:N-carbamoylputrescine amidase
MTRHVTVAATQFSCTADEARNIELAESLIRSAAIAGAQVILLPELFASTYFCQLQEDEKFDLATPVENSVFLRHFQGLSAELDVVLPVSFFEVSKTAHFNSVAVFDGGQYLGTYRKSHIPDGPGYTEKYYFTPGNTGFKVFNTRFCKLSVLICWDQWFPEAARCCCLEGAELIFYPTAIGSEPNNPGLFSRPHWQRTQCGHSAANLTPIVVSNRIGTEDKITFYGGSFITDGLGEIVKQFQGEQQSGMLLQTFDLDELLKQRRAWRVGT